MAKRRTKFRPQKAIKSLPALAAIMLLALGIFFSVLDSKGILTYDYIKQTFGLAKRAATLQNGDVAVHFIDVGQGDCELIVSGSCSVLIDAGEADYASEVGSYIKSQGISKLDYVIATHPHSDHIGGMAEIIKEFDIGKVIMPQIPDEIDANTQTYRKMLEAIRGKGLQITPAKPLETYDLGGISSLEILGPSSSDYDELNNFSVVCRLVHGENSFLFMGDAEKEEEKDIIASGAELDSDVLKVGHHGGSTSSTDDLLFAVTPRFCVISVGAENSYGHPSEKALKRLEKYTDKIYRTDLQGTITAVSDGKNINFSFEKGNG